MDYFKSAASAFLAKGGPLPNFIMGERDLAFEGKTIWSLFAATKRDDGSPCSILVFDAMQPAHNPRRSLLPLAKNALRRYRTVRHPDVVKLIDSAETATAIYIVIESVRPLGKFLEEMQGTRHQREEWVCWGLSRIANAVRFINEDLNGTHGNLRIDSIFLAASGEWRLGGLELVSAAQDEAPVLYNLGSLVPDAARYAPPEVKQQGWSILRDLPSASADSWGFGLVIVEAYNGSLPPGIVGAPSQGRTPEAQYRLLKRLMLPNAKARLPTADFFKAGQAPGGFFIENRLVKVATSLDGFLLAREDERADTIRQIKTSAQSFPPDFLHHKVLPALIGAVALTPPSAALGSGSGGSAVRILPLILQLGAPLSDSDWAKAVAPTILKAFASPDRSVRMILLETLPSYSVRFDAKQVSDKVWPNLLSGFGDTAPAIREATVKSILPLSEKLSDRILNNDLLRQLARTQVDTEPGIRTNTTILLGNLAPKLSTQTHKKVLIPAFVRSLRDPFLHARTAGIMAFLATSESFDGDDSAKQILPAMCPCLVDSEKAVRDQAKAAVATFLAKAEKTAAEMKTGSPLDTLSGENGLDTISSGNADVPSTASGAASILSRYSESLYSDKSTSRELARSSDSAVSTESSSTPLVTAEATVPGWAETGNLMDVMDDDDDWTGFQIGKQRNKTASRDTASARIPKVKASKAVDRRLGAARVAGSSPRDSPLTGSPQSALQKSILAVASNGADDAAWDEPEQTDTASVQEPQPPATLTSVSQRVGEKAMAPSPAAAFAAKAPWDPVSRSQTPTYSNTADVPNAEGATSSWAAIDDSDSDHEGKRAMPEPSQAVSKEDKRLEMERKREERRARMAQLKQSKATKLAAGLQ